MIQAGDEAHVHKHLFEKIKKIHAESGVNVLINPAGMIKNIEDYKHLRPDDLILEQQTLLRNYLNDLEKIVEEGKNLPRMTRSELEAAAPEIRRLIGG